MKEQIAIVQALVSDLFDDHWVHRRVESVEFLSDDTVARRSSIDFTIPFSLIKKLPNGLPDRFLVPLALLEKRRLVHFDFADETKRSLPLLTAAENSEIAFRVLSAEVEGCLSPAPDEQKVRQLVGSATPAEGDTLADEILSLKEVEDAGREDLKRVRAQLEDYARNFLILTPLTRTGAEDSRQPRRVLKFAYETPLGIEATRPARLLEWLGWRAKKIGLPVPSVGEGESYHIEISVPQDTEILGAGLFIDKETKPADTAVGRRHQTRIHLRVSSTTVAVGAVSILLRPRRSGLISVACLTSALVAGVMTASSLRMSQLLAHREGMGVLLLAVPTLFALYLARPPGEHDLTSGLLTGVRTQVGIAGALCFAAAASLFLYDIPTGTNTTAAVNPSDSYELLWWVFSCVAWAVVASLLVALARPRDAARLSREFGLTRSQSLPRRFYEGSKRKLKGNGIGARHKSRAVAQPIEAASKAIVAKIRDSWAPRIKKNQSQPRSTSGDGAEPENEEAPKDDTTPD